MPQPRPAQPTEHRPPDGLPQSPDEPDRGSYIGRMDAGPGTLGSSTLLDPSLGQLRAWVRDGRIRVALEALDAVHDAESTGHGEDLDGDLDGDRRAWLDALRIECLLARGDTVGAGRWAARLPDPCAVDDPVDDRDDPCARLTGPGAAVALHARAEVAAARADHERSLALFLAAGTTLVLVDGVAPGGHPADVDVPWRVGAALALVRCGRRRVAGDLAREEHALAVERHDDHSAARALRALATLAADGLAVERLEEARSLLEPDGSRRLAARIDTDLAGLMVLHGDVVRAAVLLHDAEAYAAREALWPLRSRVHKLLERLGEAPTHQDTAALDSLTPGERRVADLALDGLSNRQVAEQLDVSVKAVEGHLSKAYRKLGVHSRGALAARIGRLR